MKYSSHLVTASYVIGTAAGNGLFCLFSTGQIEDHVMHTVSM